MYSVDFPAPLAPTIGNPRVQPDIDVDAFEKEFF
jgi:hypothetical protein